MMSVKQVTLRLPDQLAADLRAEAARLGQSVNAFATLGLRALVDPDAEGEEIERLRGRLRRAGALERFEPTTLERPDEAELAEAREAAAQGRPLSEYVSEGRGSR